ncbi:MAG: PQQ-binding-like beta-propeller repeat protein [Pirellulaceae bacterium]
MNRLIFPNACCLLVLFTVTAVAEDWPGWMGPRRDNVVNGFDTVDFDAFPPKVLWQTKIAGGYAGPAVVGDRVFVMDYRTKDKLQQQPSTSEPYSGVERVLCLGAADGKPIWEHTYPVQYTVDYPAGPRCTPTVDGEHVYTLGTEGDLICFRVADGDIVWQRNLPSEYQTKTAMWGYAAHPLIDGPRLICVVGGDGSHTVAFDKQTGEQLWKQGTAPQQGYVPPTMIHAGGSRQLLTGRPDAIISLNPETGKQYWKIPYEASYGSIIMSPAKIDVGPESYLFFGGFNNKNVLVQLDPKKPEARWVWQDERGRGMSPVNVQPIVIDDVMYGFDQDGELMAVEIPSGKRLWTTGEPLFRRPQKTATAFLVRIAQTSRFFMFAETGELIVGTLDRTGFTEIDRVSLIQPTGTAYGRKVVWSPPAYAGDSIFVRNDEQIIRVKLVR